MPTVRGYCDLIFSEDAFFSPPRVERDVLRIDARQVGVLPGHPLHSTGHITYIEECVLEFHHVVRSSRRVAEYVGDPRDGVLKPAYAVVDLDAKVASGKKHRYLLNGVLDEPLSWVDWQIDAGDFVMRTRDVTSAK